MTRITKRFNSEKMFWGRKNFNAFLDRSPSPRKALLPNMRSSPGNHKFSLNKLFKSEDRILKMDSENGVNFSPSTEEVGALEEHIDINCSKTQKIQVRSEDPKKSSLFCLSIINKPIFKHCLLRNPKPTENRNLETRNRELRTNVATMLRKRSFFFLN